MTSVNGLNFRFVINLPGDDHFHLFDSFVLFLQISNYAALFLNQCLKFVIVFFEHSLLLFSVNKNNFKYL